MATTTPLKNDDNLLARFIDELVGLYDPRRIILFGSRARGDAGVDSDYDLMVLVSDDSSSAVWDRSILYDHMWDLGIAADVLIWTESAYTEKLHLKASLPATIEREGSEIYAA